MEVRLIKTYTTIIKLGNFQKAARALNYSQPTITLHIKNLEKELGVKLLERGKTIEMTEAGRLFYERANALLREYDHLDKTIQDLEKGDAGLVRLGISEPNASLEFPNILSEFSNLYPNIEITIKVAEDNILSDMLHRDELDFAICAEPEISFENYFKPLYIDELILLVDENHKLASKISVKISELEKETFIVTSKNSPMRMKMEQVIVESIGTNYKKMEVSSSMAHKYYVKAGLGISFFTKTALATPFPGTKIVKIKDLDASIGIGLLSKKVNSCFGKATNHLLTMISDYYEKKNLKHQLKQFI